MKPEHSREGVLALRRLAAGPGGGVLVVTGEAAPYYAGVQRPPVRTLLEAVLTLAADAVYQRIAVFSGAGRHLPPVQVGERLVVGRLAAGWLARGEIRPILAPVSSALSRDNDDDDADYDRHYRERLAAGPAERILFHSQNPDWAAQMSTVLQHLDQLCGVSWNGQRHVPIPGAAPPRTLVLLDEMLFRPTFAQVNAVVTQTVCPPTEGERAGLEARFRALPGLVRQKPIDLILFARSAGIGELLCQGTLAREEVPEVPTCRPELFPELRWDGCATVVLPSGRHGPYLEDGGEKLSRYDAFRVLPPSSPRTPIQDLEDMIGLNSVKEQVKRLQARAWEIRQRRQMGLPTEEFHLHTIFYGNPGTGKTRVAALLGRIFVGLELLSGSKITEVTPTDLIAEYIGQTAPKTRRVLQDALGGVLFIDEANGLRPQERGFQEECIREMLPWLTNQRAHLAVILAGYPERIKDMLGKVDPGFQRRFQNNLYFPDYTDEELVRICQIMTRRSGDELAPGCEAVIRGKLQRQRQTSGPQFGNAGEVERLLDRAREVRAQRLRRLASPMIGDFRQFLPGDFEQAQLTAVSQIP